MAHERIKVGDKLPDFTLKDHHGKELRITELKGRKVLLSFHPLAWTGVCTKQMKSLEQSTEQFTRMNTVALGISVDAVPSKHAWAKHELHLTQTRLLSDFWPHGGVAQKLGMFRDDDGFAERANIIVDEEQRVVFVKVYDIPQLPDINEIIKFLEK
jgi:peroxiredoxin